MRNSTYHISVFRASPFVHGSGFGEEVWAHEVQWKDCKTLTLSKFRMSPDRKTSQENAFSTCFLSTIAMPIGAEKIV